MECLKNLTSEFVRQSLSYDPETGSFLWKNRPREHFATRNAHTTWNTKFAGTIAGSKNDQGYLRISIGGRRYRAHRLAFLIMTGEWPTTEIDHKNLDRSDNRWMNIRPATRSQNHANKRRRANNKCGFKGVSLHKKSGLWFARINQGGKQIYLGYFKRPEDAHEAYLSAATKIYGAFARSA